MFKDVATINCVERRAFERKAGYYIGHLKGAICESRNRCGKCVCAAYGPIEKINADHRYVLGFSEHRIEHEQVIAVCAPDVNYRWVAISILQGLRQPAE